jgi:hypothetical protein
VFPSATPEKRPAPSKDGKNGPQEDVEVGRILNVVFELGEMKLGSLDR